MRLSDTVVLGWVDYGSVDSRFALTVAGLFAHRIPHLIAPLSVSGGLVTRQRNELVQAFLVHSKADWLLMLDSDMSFGVEAILRLFDAADGETTPIISGLYFGVRPGEVLPTPHPHLYRVDEAGYSIPIDDYPENQIIDVDSVGGGFVLVHRTVLETVRARQIEAFPDTPPGYAWFEEGPYLGRYAAEDFNFCRRVREAGYQIRAHTGAVAPHHKQIWVGEDLYRIHRFTQQEGATNDDEG